MVRRHLILDSECGRYERAGDSTRRGSEKEMLTIETTAPVFTAQRPTAGWCSGAAGISYLFGLLLPCH
jgi:hypothetical protein